MQTTSNKLRNTAIGTGSGLVAAGALFVAPQPVEAGTQPQVNVTINNHVHMVPQATQQQATQTTYMSLAEQEAQIHHINRIYVNRPLPAQTIVIIKTFDPFLVGRHLHPLIIQRHFGSFHRRGWFCPCRHIPLHRHLHFSPSFRNQHFPRYRNLRHDFPQNQLRTTINNRNTVVNNNNVVNNNQINNNVTTNNRVTQGTPPRGSTAPRGTFERTQQEQSRNSSARSSTQRQTDASVRSSTATTRNSGATGTRNTGTRNQQQNQSQRSSERGR